MAKLNGKALLAQAEAEGSVFRIKQGWRRYMKFCAILVSLFVITIPLGIWFWIVANNARAGLTADGFAVRWFGHRAYAWDEIASFKELPLHFHVSGQGLAGALVGLAASSVVSKRTEGLKGPLSFTRKGKRGVVQIPAHALQDSVRMAREMERLSGLAIFPVPMEEAPEGQ